MLETTNYNLNKIELTDSPPDITVINPNWDAIDAEMKSLRELNENLVADYIRSPGYGVTTGSANIYALTLNPALAAYTAGVCVAVKINIANTGASTININGLGAKPIKDSKGNALVSGKLAMNGVYTFRYDGTNFILQGEGGEYGTATASDVLSGKTIGTDSGLVTGTIPSKAAATITPSTIAQTIAAGQYLSGIQTILGDADLVSTNIKASANIFGVAGKSTIVDTEDADAIAGLLYQAKTAYVGGNKITGTMPWATRSFTPNTVNQVIPEGYHSGGGYVEGSPNLLSANIKSGVNVFGVVGTFNGSSFPSTFIASAYVTANGTVAITINMSLYDEVELFCRQSAAGSAYAQVIIGGFETALQGNSSYTNYYHIRLVKSGSNVLVYSFNPYAATPTSTLLTTLTSLSVPVTTGAYGGGAVGRLYASAFGK